MSVFDSRAALIFELWALIGTAACTQPMGETVATSEPVNQVLHPTQPNAASTEREIPTEGLPATVRDAVLEAAAHAGGVDTAAVEIIRAESVTWSDGSLGCPRPGQMYTQALVPGYRIVVRAGEHALQYHANERGHVVRCARSAQEIIVPGIVDR